MSKLETHQATRRRLQVSDLHPHLMCILCGGYYVDATTIIECLHSFCKSCLVRYLESNKYCPICEVQVHKTKPLQNIRPDETLQNMVYKLVPGLFHREMRFRQEFYAQHPEAPPSSPEDRGIVDPLECQYYSPDEPVSLALEFKNDSANSSNSNGIHRRYLRCPAAVTVAHLQKLVRNKFGLEPYYNVEVMFNDKILTPDFNMMDVAYSFQRKRKEQFHFTYRIVDAQCKRMRLEAPALNAESCEEMDLDQPNTPSTVSAPESKTSVSQLQVQLQPESKSKLDSIISRLGIAKQTENVLKKEMPSQEWKEVQLQISENGEMSVSPIDKLIDTIEKNIGPTKNSPLPQSNSVRQKGSPAIEEKVSSLEVKMEVDPVVPPDVKSAPLSDTGVKTEKVKDVTEPVKSNSISNSVKVSSPSVKMEPKGEGSLRSKLSTDVKKDEGKKVLKTEANESKSVPIPSVSLASKVSSVSSAEQNLPVQKPPTYTVPSALLPSSSQSNIAHVSTPAQTTPKLPIVTSGSNSPLLSAVTMTSSACAPLTSLSMASATSSKPMYTALTTTTVARAAPVAVAKPVPMAQSAKKSSSPVGYKTLKCGPKNWNPSISRNSFLSSKQEQQPLQQGTSSGSSGKPITPPRFFKMRNTPRFLGNPASGVKAMYQVPDSKPDTPPPAKSPSVMKLDPRTLTPIVSNASSPTSKSPVLPKGRPPFPSTTLSAQVSSHMPSSRSVATTTTTTSTATKLSDLSSLRNSPSQPIGNPFLPNPFGHKGMPNFLYGGLPGLLPSGAAQFASMLRPGLGYPSVTTSGFHPTLPQPGMLFNPHSLHRQLSSSSPCSPTSFPSSLPSSSSSVSISPASASSSSSLSVSSSSGNQRTPSSEKSVSTQSSSQRSSKSNALISNLHAHDSGKVNGSETPKNSMINKQKLVSSASQEPVLSEAKTKANSAALSRDSTKSASDNNNTVSISKSKVQLDQHDGSKPKPPLDISKLVSKESGKCSDDQLIASSVTPTSTSFQAQQS